MSSSEEASKPAAERLEEEVSETEEVKIIVDRIYTVPLSDVIYVPHYKRAKKAISILRKFVTRHMKPDELIIDPKVNEYIWKNGIKRPPRRIRIRATKDTEGIVKVYLA
ncbi:MAG: 50S ribosomal protein L31e [Candidatus Asgardarchaeia archaeon]